MLSNNVPKDRATVVQVGGGIKELYYYPASTVQVRTTLWRNGGAPNPIELHQRSPSPTCERAEEVE
jgi:hypothetical protein